MKIKFDFICPDQSWQLLTRTCLALNIKSPEKSLKQALGGSHNITSGDFAAIVRKHRFQPIKSAADIVDSLRNEANLKEARKRSIEFI